MSEFDKQNGSFNGRPLISEGRVSPAPERPKNYYVEERPLISQGHSVRPSEKPTNFSNVRPLISDGGNVKPFTMSGNFSAEIPLSSREVNVQTCERQVKNIKDRSTKKATSTEQVRKRKAQVKAEEVKKRLTALCLACVVAGGIAATTAAKVVDKIQENSIVYSQTADFRRDVMAPNTHPTENGKYYWYDYEEIAEALLDDGKDFSQELYKTYYSIGEEQTNRVLECTDYGTLEDYAKSVGFKNVDKWADNERQKVLLTYELNEMNSELSSKHTDFNSNEKGGNK